MDALYRSCSLNLILAIFVCKQNKAWRRPLSKIHVPQRGFPLKSVYYQQGPF